MPRDPWRRSAAGWESDFERRPLWTGTKLTVAVVLSVFVVVAVVFGIITGFSYWWGQGGAVQQKNSTGNFVAQEARFHNDQNAALADVAKIKDARQAITAFDQAHPGYQGNGTPYDPLAQQLGDLNTTLQGLQQGCQNEVTDYNDAASEFLSADWRDAGLPPHLDLTMCD